MNFNQNKITISRPVNSFIKLKGDASWYIQIKENKEISLVSKEHFKDSNVHVGHSFLEALKTAYSNLNHDFLHAIVNPNEKLTLLNAQQCNQIAKTLNQITSITLASFIKFSEKKNKQAGSLFIHDQGAWAIVLSLKNKTSTNENLMIRSLFLERLTQVFEEVQYNTIYNEDPLFPSFVLNKFAEESDKKKNKFLKDLEISNELNNNFNNFIKKLGLIFKNLDRVKQLLSSLLLEISNENKKNFLDSLTAFFKYFFGENLNELSDSRIDHLQKQVDEIKYFFRYFKEGTSEFEHILAALSKSNKLKFNLIKNLLESLLSNLPEEDEKTAIEDIITFFKNCFDQNLDKLDFPAVQLISENIQEIKILLPYFKKEYFTLTSLDKKQLKNIQVQSLPQEIICGSNLLVGFRGSEIRQYRSLLSFSGIIKIKKQKEKEGNTFAEKRPGAAKIRVFRDADKISNRYGGAPTDWEKKFSASSPEVHWVENSKTKQRVEFKTKFERPFFEGTPAEKNHYDYKLKFEKFISSLTVPVLLYFVHPICFFSLEMRPIIYSFIKEYMLILFDINDINSSKLFFGYGLTSVPSIIIYNNKSVSQKEVIIEGTWDKKALKF